MPGFILRPVGLVPTQRQNIHSPQLLKPATPFGWFIHLRNMADTALTIIPGIGIFVLPHDLLPSSRARLLPKKIALTSVAVSSLGVNFTQHNMQTHRLFSLIRGVLALLLLLQFSACSLNRDNKQAGEASGPLPVNVPKWNCLAKMTASSADLEVLPKPVYVFPALRLGPKGQPIDALQHHFNAAGEVYWTSPAPRSHEIKSGIEKKLSAMGFRVLSFHEMTEQNRDHSILILNPYFSDARVYGGGSPAEATGWTVFTRILGSTFPTDLNPAGKRDLFNVEGVSLFTDKENALSVVKRVTRYSLKHMGTTREWSETLSLLN